MTGIVLAYSIKQHKHSVHAAGCQHLNLGHIETLSHGSAGQIDLLVKEAFWVEEWIGREAEALASVKKFVKIHACVKAEQA